jgi:glucose/arabinose dehydrogenase
MSFFVHSASCQNKTNTEKLPAPYATKSVTVFADVVGWKENEKPFSLHGFVVTKYADGFDNPRWLYELPNGDILVAESNFNLTVPEKVGARVVGAAKSHDTKKSADRITLLRDRNNDGIPEVRDTFLAGLNQPFGMLYLNGFIYVANTDALVKYPYKDGDKNIFIAGQKILDLPSLKDKQDRHWTRNIIASPDGSKIFISIGSSSNIAENGIEKEILRANIIEINPDGSGQKIYASGLRNPVGMDWEPGTKTLWVAVNERDELGDDLVPDYVTSVKKDGFYGWPYSYYGQNIDPRVKESKLELVKKAIVPDFPVGAHTATLGLAFYTKTSFPEKYRNGMFLTQHGSWNRSVLAGYKVTFIPFKNGKPSGPMEDFLEFRANVDPKSNKVHGRPVGIAVLQNGNLLISDDTGNTLWLVSAQK